MNHYGTDSVLSVYSDARTEYTKQLCVFLVPAYFQFYTELLERAKKAMTSEPKKVLWQFQNYLNEIHDWNMEKVNQEIRILQQNSGCDYLDDLLTAVFIAHTKVLTAIRLHANHKKVEITIPKVDHFLFKALCETSKLLWSSTYLFRDGIPAIEKQLNYRTIENLLNEGIIQAVRSLVPVKSILKDFMSSEGIHGSEAAQEDSDDEVEPAHLPPQSSEPPLEAESSLVELNIPQATTTRMQEPPLMQEPPPITSPSVPVLSLPLEAPREIVQMQADESPHESQESQTIVIPDKPSVRFGQFNAVFGLDDPSHSDMIYDQREIISEEHLPDLEILDESGGELSEETDFVNLDDLCPSAPESVSTADYEEL